MEYEKIMDLFKQARELKQRVVDKEQIEQDKIFNSSSWNTKMLSKWT